MDRNRFTVRQEEDQAVRPFLAVQRPQPEDSRDREALRLQEVPEISALRDPAFPVDRQVPDRTEEEEVLEKSRREGRLQVDQEDSDLPEKQIDSVLAVRRPLADSVPADKQMPVASPPPDKRAPAVSRKLLQAVSLPLPREDSAQKVPAHLPDQ